MISDGYGPASHTFARSLYRTLHAETVPEIGWGFPLDAKLVGSHRSRSSDSLITDSAAGATAFSCGLKSYNGAIGVDSHGKPCGTIFEAAKSQGYLTGVVVTSRLTDATPACFFAHASSRSLESEIAAQMLQSPFDGAQRTIDLAIGGGGCYYLPASHEMSCRDDDRDLVKEATEAGWDVHFGSAFASQAEKANTGGPDNSSSAAAAAAAPAKASHHLPLLSLVTPWNNPYVIDQQGSSSSGGEHSVPTLAESAEQAIRLLSFNARRGGKGDKDGKGGKGDDKEGQAFAQSKKSNHTGFMLMIEGSQIDLCQHENDPACMGREAIAYQEAASRVVDLVDELNAKGEKTLLISTSDHETGGLALGRQLGPSYPDYAWYPRRLVGAKHSAKELSAKLGDFVSGKALAPTEGVRPQTALDLRGYIAESILGTDDGLGFGSAETGGPPTEGEVDKVMDCLRASGDGQMRIDNDADIDLDSSSSSSSSSSLSSTTLGAPPIDPNDSCRNAIADVASRRAQVGWSTHGHTGVDINVYAHGYGAEDKRLRGNIENTDIGSYIAQLLGLDLQWVSDQLGKSE